MILIDKIDASKTQLKKATNFVHMLLFLLFHQVCFGQWIPLGPSPSINGQVELESNNEVVGAINVVLPHPLDSNTVYIGTVNGGIWRTFNAKGESIRWEPLTDQFASLSISVIELDPTDPNMKTLVAGIGTRSSYRLVDFQFGGLLVSLLIYLG